MVGILEMICGRCYKTVFLCGFIGAVHSLLTGGCGTSAVSSPDGVGRESSAVSVRETTGDDADEYRNLALFTEALLLINRYHVDEHQFDRLVYSAIEGMVGRLDAHSSFLVPESLRSLDESTEGRFVGIGVNVEPGTGGVKVLAPLEGSPALKAGIRAGDTITAVNGASLQGVDLKEAVEKIRGEAGSKVHVTVERAGGETAEVELVRDDIRISSVQSCRMIDDKTGFLRVRQFTNSTVSEVGDALDSLVDKGMRRLVIDLRDNPGGVLGAAVDFCQLFLEKGALIVTLKSRGEENGDRRFTAESGCRLPEMPVAVLVNRGSASASEVVAGALRDNGRAVLVGEKSYGKASVQSIIKMSLQPECALRLTTGYYFTPDGGQIHGRGIVPDEVVPLDYEQEDVIRKHYRRDSFSNSSSEGAEVLMQDAQLAKALEILGRSEGSGGMK